MGRLLAALGRRTARWLARVGALARFSYDSIASLRTLPGAGRRVAGRVLANQVRFTALEGAALVLLLSGVLSFLVISSAVRQLGQVGATDLIGELMVVVIVRELGPLLTALAVAGRSGTAIAAELATNTVMGEVRSLEAMGIDPYHYLVLPRLFGSMLSVAILIVVFDVVSLFAGLLAAGANGMSAERYFGGVLGELTTGDLALTVVKGLIFGALIGLVPSFQGLSVRGDPTEIPRAVIRGTVGVIALIFVMAAIFVIAGGG
ncbi:MAG: MlaE family ABC transporter permease [Gemmatimonadales bacterium]